MFVPSKIV